ncbi:MAG TPA: DUF6279 family lipoprotein [Candidatus Competibacteraceae bacterium]|nr:DUF6279 family lipoprotein [Candidatus Competibacteraceae bacterium]
MRSPLLRTLFRFFLPAFLALAVANCSVLRLAYYHIDYWLLGQVEDFVTLNAEQRAWLEVRLQAHRQWHCRTQLPAYAEWLDALSVEIASPAPDPVRLEALAQRLDSFIDAILAEFAPTLAELLVRLDPAQRTELFARLDQEVIEARIKYLDPPADERQRERAERLKKRLKPWIGDLTIEQSTRIQQWSAALDNQSGGWLAHRQRLLEAVRETLKRADNGVARARLVGLFQTPASVRTEDYIRQATQNRIEALALTVDLIRLATSQQRTRLKKRIGDLRTDLQAISCGDPTLAASANRISAKTD